MWCLSHSPWKFSNLTSLNYNYRLGLFLLMHFAFSPQCSHSSGPHLPILSWHHYSNNHLLDFPLIATASKVRTEYWFLAALGMWPQNARPHFWEATRQPDWFFNSALCPCGLFWFDQLRPNMWDPCPSVNTQCQFESTFLLCFSQAWLPPLYSHCLSFCHHSWLLS